MNKHKRFRKISSAKSHKMKKKNIIKLPAKFANFIKDEKMRDEFINFASKRDTRPSYSELTSYVDAWITGINGKSYNPDDISLNTYMLMRKDAQLQLGLKVIKLPIKAMKWWVVCQDENIKAFIHYNLKLVWSQMMNAILNALDFGWSACEKIWEIKDVEIERREGEKIVKAFKGKAVMLKKLKDQNPLQVTILTDDNGDFNGFEQEVGGGSPIIVPAEKAFVFTNEKEFGNLYGKSMLRYSYDYWYWATLMYQFLNRYFERRGTPPVLARAPGGRTNLSDGTVLDNLLLAQKAGESLSESSVVALPSVLSEGQDVYKWNLEYMKDDQRADMFIRYIEHLNAMKLRGLFVPERMVIQDSQMGARSVAETHMDVFLMGLEGLTRDIIDHLNKYIIPQLIRYNFGNDVPPAFLETSGLSAESKNLLKQIIVTVLKKGDGNIPLDMVKALEELDLPIGKFGPREDVNKSENNIDEGNKENKEDEDEDMEAEGVSLRAIKKILED